MFAICHLFPLVSPLQKKAYMIASGVICLIYILCAIVLFFGVTEQKGNASFSQINRLHFSILEYETVLWLIKLLKF